MFAIIQTGGKQYKVEKGQILEVEQLSDKEGSTISLDNVLLINNNSDTKVGMPVIEGAYVSAKVVEHKKGDKILVFKMKAKKRYENKNGFRRSLTMLEIIDIHEKGGKVEAKKEEKVEKVAEEKPKTVKKTTKKTVAKEQDSLL